MTLRWLNDRLIAGEKGRLKFLYPTRSNKIAELAVRNVIHNLPVKNIEALANPEALELFRSRSELLT